ncbi:hypothetical protein Tco_0620057 [Tanacetum coccineum]
MLAPKCPTFNGRPTFANLMYLKKSQYKKLCLYAIPHDQSDPANIIPDREEILTLEEESRSKLNKDLVKPFDYTKLNSTVCFGNDQFALILGYRDLVQGNITINKVYYLEGLNHNLFSVGKFRDADLEVAFRKSMCFVRDLQGNDLLPGIHAFWWDTPLSQRDIVSTTREQGLSFPKRLKRHQSYDNPDPAPELQNVSPSADTIVPSQQELDLLFGPLYDEFFNDAKGLLRKRVLITKKSFAQLLAWKAVVMILSHFAATQVFSNLSDGRENGIS